LLQTRLKLRSWPNVVPIFLDSISISRHPGIAVILSGLDSDGAAALRAFKESGGVTIAQAPQSAERAQMPLAAIQTACVDYVLMHGQVFGRRSLSFLAVQ
jgi:chemotaxis response regulator CheB